MQIVIDIDDDLYTRLFDNGNKHVSDMRRACVAIRKGTPLPKGHGRLIDADAFQKYCFNKNFDRRLSEVGLATINMFLELQPTIIEADGGEEDGKDKDNN